MPADKPKRVPLRTYTSKENVSGQERRGYGVFSLRVDTGGRKHIPNGQSRIFMGFEGVK